MLLVDSRGAPLQLGAVVGSGGEGKVYEVVGKPTTLAKLYHQPLSTDRKQKLTTMARANAPALAAMTAWPADIISTSGTAIGFLMPRVSGSKDIHKLYSPKSRKVEFPKADFRFLVHVSANVARAFAAVHAAGAVVGDVNHGGVLIAENATVRLIDCDSFQFSADGKTFFCEVGVPTFTPPELQNRPLRNVLRTPNHDGFGLAVLIFHLLFLGRHPFAGRYSGTGDMPIETAIQQFRFAYARDAASKQMQPPPNVPGLGLLPNDVADLFEAAFGSKGVNGGRPSASDWIEPLQKLEDALKSCSSNRSHVYPARASSCPWCAIENTTGLPLFNFIVLPTTQVGQFDLVTVWKTIGAITLALPPPPLRIEQIAPPQPTPEAVKIASKARHDKRARLASLTLLVVGTLLLLAALPNLWVLWLTFSFLLGQGIMKKFTTVEVSQLKERERIANLDYSHKLRQHDAAQRVSTSAVRKFNDKRAELGRQKAALEQLPKRRALLMQNLERERQRQQLQIFLGKFFLEDAAIPGVGPGRKAILESYGIETAADLEHSAIVKVPGFGPAMAKKLLAWRTNVERDFRFDPTKPIDPQAIAAMDQALSKEKKAAEQALISGVSELLSLKRSAELQLNAMRADVEAAARELAQARVNASL